ncbi:hypothetical protein C8R48DRAFT_779125 [Suillus tomentosus]|nr:hypothetical protein C8R48DRAFT_779125 [Suillus tomentosus]
MHISAFPHVMTKPYNAFQRLKAIQKRENLQSFQKKKKFRNSHYTPHRDDAMEVDWLEIARLSKSEVRRHLKEGQCFNCHQVGHRANDTAFHPCEEKTQKAPIRRKTEKEEEESSGDEVKNRHFTTEMDF